MGMILPQNQLGWKSETPPQERDTGAPSTVMDTHTQTPQKMVISHWQRSISTFHFYFTSLLQQTRCNSDICLARSSGGVTPRLDLQIVDVFLSSKTRGKNTSPTLLPPLLSMLRLKREVLQIHAHANMKYIRILHLESLCVKLIWHLNV